MIQDEESDSSFAPALKNKAKKIDQQTIFRLSSDIDIEVLHSSWQQCLQKRIQLGKKLFLIKQKVQVKIKQTKTQYYVPINGNNMKLSFKSIYLWKYNLAKGQDKVILSYPTVCRRIRCYTHSLLPIAEQREIAKKKSQRVKMSSTDSKAALRDNLQKIERQLKDLEAEHNDTKTLLQDCYDRFFDIRCRLKQLVDNELDTTTEEARCWTFFCSGMPDQFENNFQEKPQEYASWCVEQEQ